jgi:hypothetical protein
MHLEILVEDLSGKEALELLIPRILGGSHTFRVHPYKGIGRLPRNLRDTRDASRRILLENLPKLLKGYGRAQAGRKAFSEAVILVCDLDDRCLKEFLNSLKSVLAACHPKPETRFCFAIEEGEAWLLGDRDAVKAAYPAARDDVLQSYVNDSICGTWERLADAVYPGGSKSLAAKGWQAVGAEKTKWAEAIAPRVSIAANCSPSFRYFVARIQELTQTME